MVKMVRGYQKRVIFLKKTGSEIFDEAYFILSDSYESASGGECDMIAEANRIIDENLCLGQTSKAGFFSRVRRSFTRWAISFLIGAIAGFITCLAIFVW